MRKIVILFLFLSAITLNSQNFTLSGVIKDCQSLEALIYANIGIKNTNKFVTSNEYGFYSINLPKGENTIIFNLLGYETQLTDINITKDTVLNIGLVSQSVEIQKIIVKGSQRQSNNFEIPIAKLNKIPLIAGETDVLKSMLTYTGVAAGTEGSAGFNVRGGSSDQNLYLIDGIPVYNVNHLFGFFSVFNSDAIKSVRFIKGGIPAEFYGKVSSIVDLYMKEGNMQKYHTSISVGILAAKFMVEGPIKKQKSSFMISARRTYLDLLAKPFTSAIFNINNLGLYFYDINAKMNFKLSPKNTLYFSFYSGFDKFIIKDKQSNSNISSLYSNSLNWGNFTSAIRFVSLLSKKVSFTNLLYFSKYDYSNETNSVQNILIENNNLKTEYLYSGGSGIKEIALKSKFDIYLSNSDILKTGFVLAKKYYSQNFSSLYSNDAFPEQNIPFTKSNPIINSFEFSGFIENTLKYQFFNSNLGLNFNSFNVNDTTYFFFEPRINLVFKISTSLNFEASYSKTHQYLHLLTNSTLGLPSDLWVPTTKKVLPINAQIYDAGINVDLSSSVNLSFSGFYKTFNNLIEYQQGANLLDTKTDWQNKITTGKGFAYGLEFSLQKNSDKFNFQINYTYSRSIRHFNSLNDGKPFPYKFDRPHNFNFQCEYSLNPRVSFYINWILMSGQNATYSNHFFIFSNYTLDMKYAQYFYTSINNLRLPTYHRLDFAVNFTKIKTKATRVWSVGIYNVYNRLNPFYLSQTSNPNELKGVSYAPIMPFVSYSIKF